MTVCPEKISRILCISTVTVPQANSEAFCGAKMAAALRAADVDVQIICDGNYISEPGAPYDNSSYWSSLNPATHAVRADEKRNVFKALACAVRYRALKMHPRWVNAVVSRARELHRRKPFDLVYSRSPASRAHVAGYWTKRALRVPWVANINDPWELHLFPDCPPRKVSAVYDAVSKYWLRKTLRSADLVTYPSARLAAFTQELAGVRQNSAVIEHIGRAAEDPPAEAGVFRFVHAGKLTARSRTQRSAAGLLQGLRRFLAMHPEASEHTELVLLGPEDEESRRPVEELGLAGIVRCVGRKSYQESLRFISAAAVCVLVEAQMKEGIYLPSKFADYIVARKPVLALSPQNGTIADIDDAGVMRVDPDDAEGIADAIEKYYEDFTNGSLARRTPSEKIARAFEADSVAQKFLNAVRRIRRGTPV